MRHTVVLIGELVDQAERVADQIYRDVSENGGLTSNATIRLSGEIKRTIDRLDREIGMQGKTQ